MSVRCLKNFVRFLKWFSKADHCSLTSNLVKFEFPETKTIYSESYWPEDFKKALDLALSSYATFLKVSVKIKPVLTLVGFEPGSSCTPIRLQSPYINIEKNSWYKNLVYVFMAQLVTANSKLFSKSPDHELSESVVKVSGNSKFTRLDVREQWDM